MGNAPAGVRLYHASRRNGTLYIGVASDLVRRVWQHREGIVEGFAKTHGCTLLVWLASFDDIQDARAVELRMKKWNRVWKLRVIEEQNPQWRDLYLDLV